MSDIIEGEDPIQRKRLHVITTPDDGDVPHALCLWFGDDEEAYARVWKTKFGEMVVQSMASSASVRGREMLQYLRDAYGLPIVPVEVTHESVGFWRRMAQEKLISYFTMATGRPDRREKESVPLLQSSPGR